MVMLIYLLASLVLASAFLLAWWFDAHRTDREARDPERLDPPEDDPATTWWPPADEDMDRRTEDTAPLDATRRDDDPR